MKVQKWIFYVTTQDEQLSGWPRSPKALPKAKTVLAGHGHFWSAVGLTQSQLDSQETATSEKYAQ